MQGAQNLSTIKLVSFERVFRLFLFCGRDSMLVVNLADQFVCCEECCEYFPLIGMFLKSFSTLFLLVFILL